MAKKKAKDTLQDLSVQEAQAQLREAKEKSFKLKFQHASSPLKNPMELRVVRRQIAKLMTVLRQKEKVA